jgi:hypothetical protein
MHAWQAWVGFEEAGLFRSWPALLRPIFARGALPPHQLGLEANPVGGYSRRWRMRPPSVESCRLPQGRCCWPCSPTSRRPAPWDPLDIDDLTPPAWPGLLVCSIVRAGGQPHAAPA